MTVTELSNLFVAYNEEENFRILVCALDEEEAMETAREYASDTNLSSRPNDWKISEFTNEKTKFDCDYVISSGQ